MYYILVYVVYTRYQVLFAVCSIVLLILRTSTNLHALEGRVCVTCTSTYFCLVAQIHPCCEPRSIMPLNKLRCLLSLAQFVSKYISTIGIDYGVKPVSVNGESVRINFWDLSGHPDFFEIRNEFYKDSQGVRTTI